MKKVIVFIACFLAALPVFSQEGPQKTKLAIKLLTPQKTVLVGEPIFFSATVTNEGPVTAKVVIPSGDVFGPWLYQDCCKEALVIQGATGQIRYGAFGVLYAVLKPGESKITPHANPGGLILSVPGRYEVWAELQSTGINAGPTVSPNPPQYEYFWKGHTISNRCSIDVQAPTGVDAQAYQAFKGHPLKHPAKLLKRFPTSTYAACAVYGIMHGFMQGDENMFLRSVERGTYLSNSYPDGTGKSKDGWRWLKGQAAVDWWSKWINIILTNHPDIWFADQLRLKRAVDQVALKNYQAGAADLEALTQEATPEVAQKARDILGMMRTKGWIKKEPPRSK